MGKKHNEKRDNYTLYKDYINFKNKKVLDFGGNFDNLIRSADGDIQQKNYTVIDLDEVAMELGKSTYPEATWIISNEHNPVYNPAGKDKLELKETYDLVFAYSVYTHMSLEKFEEHIQIFKQHLNPNGKIALTVCSTSNERIKKYFWERRVALYNSCDDLVFSNDVTYLIDNKLSFDYPNQCNQLITWYDKSFLEKYGTFIEHPTHLDLLIIEK